MMELGTLLAVLQVSAKLVTVCHEYILGVKNAPRDVLRIIDEITSVRNTIEQLIQHVNQTGSPLSAGFTNLNQHNGPFEKCLAELTDLEKVIDDGKRKGPLTSKLVWPLKQKETEAKLAALATIKSSLQLALTADNAQTLSEIWSETKSLPVIQKHVDNFAKHAAEAAQDDVKKRMIKELRGRDQSQRHRMHYEKHVEATGDWLLNHAAYLKWLETAGGILWLRGLAGCGKTVLCAHIIENLTLLCVGEATAIVYFYVDGSESLPLDACTVNRTFLSQLVEQIPSLVSELEGRSYVEMTNRPERYLRMGLRSVEHLYVVVDGLDECEDSLGLQGAVEFLVETMLLGKDKVHVVAASRTSAHVRAGTTGIEVSEVLLGECKDNDDLHLLLQSRLQNDWAFKSWPKALKCQVETTLLSKAQSSIHWVSCQLDSLKGCKTTKAVQTKLTDLPRSLETYYIRELARLEETHGASVRNAFRWIACSLRPLSVSELAVAVSVNIEDEDEPFTDETLDVFDIDGFLDSCSSLVATYSSGDQTKDRKQAFLMFTHFSVLEFLRGDAIKAESCSQFALAQDVVHTLLAKSCMAIIRKCALPPSPHDVRPCLKYAARFWLQHKCRSRNQDWSSEEARNNLYVMFDSTLPYFMQWIGLSSIDKPWIDKKASESDDGVEMSQLTPLYSAALFGLSEVAKGLLESGEDANVRWGIYGYPLQAASAGGYFETVTVLIEGGADVNATGGRFGSAISAAAANGHQEIVTTLIKLNAELHPLKGRLSDRRDDPLFLAVKYGHRDICKILLEHGAEDCYAMKSSPCTALHAAVESGRIDIVRIMLGYDQVQQANRRVRHAKTAPHGLGFAKCQRSAAANGDTEMFKELLAYGIRDADLLRCSAQLGEQELFTRALSNIANAGETEDINSSSEALRSAALSGHAASVQTLLVQGSDKDLSSHLSRALEASVEGGNMQIARALIQAGAMVKDYRSNYWKERPIARAIALRRVDFIDLFLEHGANLSRNLQTSVAFGDVQEFKFLLGLGARLDYRRMKKSGPGITMLQAAAFSGSVAIVQYLLDNEADPNEASQTSPLNEAIRCQHWPVVELLLHHGADLNALPGTYRDNNKLGFDVINMMVWPSKPATETALALAIKHDNEDLAKELLQRGAHPCPPTPPTAGTPLLYAIWEDMIEISQLLIDGCANVNKSGTILHRDKPSFPLMLAAERGSMTLVAMLLDAGATINEQDSEGFSVLHAAAVCPSVALLKSLIEHHGADPTLCLDNGSQPIHSAAARGTVEHVKVLLDNGVSVDVRNHSGRTPLHWAAERENVEIVELLLDRGADANLKADEAHLTPLDLACVSKERPWGPHLWDRSARLEEDTARMRSRLEEAMT